MIPNLGDVKTYIHLVQPLIARILFHTLTLLGWKRSTVRANLRHVRATAGIAIAEDELYRDLMWNLAREFTLVLFNRNPGPQAITPRAQALLPELRKGGMLLTAHFGNWEWMGPWLRSIGVPLVASYLPLKNRLANAMMQKLRNRNGLYAYDLSANPFRLRTLLERGALFTFLADQDHRPARALGPSPESRISTQTFLGKPVSLNPLPDTVVRLFPTLPVYFAWVARDDFGALVLDCIPLSRFGGDPEWSPMGAYHRQLEELIRQFPTQWPGWTHRRYLSTSPTIYKQ